MTGKERENERGTREPAEEKTEREKESETESGTGGDQQSVPGAGRGHGRGVRGAALGGNPEERVDGKVTERGTEIVRGRGIEIMRGIETESEIMREKETVIENERRKEKENETGIVTEIETETEKKKGKEIENVTVQGIGIEKGKGIVTVIENVAIAGKVGIGLKKKGFLHRSLYHQEADAALKNGMKEDQRGLIDLAAVPAHPWTLCLPLGHLIEETTSVRKAAEVGLLGNTERGRQENESEVKIENLKRGNHTLSCLHSQHQETWRLLVMMKTYQICLQKQGKWKKNTKGKTAWMR